MGMLIKNSNLKPKDILNISKKYQLSTFDTSDNYEKDFFYVIKNYKKCRLIIKLSSKKNNQPTSFKVFKNQIAKIKKKINIKSIYAILIHNFDLKFEKKYRLHYQYLMNFCLQNKLNFGFSIYNLKEFNVIKKLYKFNVLQIPVSIFNQEFIDPFFIKYVKKNKIEVHARSIFLQGLLVNDLEDIPNKFVKFKKLFISWNHFCETQHITKVQACLNFVDNISFVNKIIIGFKNVNELREIINYSKIKILKKFIVKKISKKLINPNKWSSIM